MLSVGAELPQLVRTAPNGLGGGLVGGIRANILIQLLPAHPLALVVVHGSSFLLELLRIWPEPLGATVTASSELLLPLGQQLVLPALVPLSFPCALSF